MADDTRRRPDDDFQEELVSESNRYGMTPERLARRVAALRDVRQFGDPVLVTPSAPIEHFDDALRHQFERMAFLMNEAYAAGLAANQVGVLRRIFVYHRDPETTGTPVINPVIEWMSDETEVGEEGCLSLPEGLWTPVERALKIRVRFQDLEGNEVVYEPEGYEARVFQHETDHLDGVLMIDRTTKEERKRALQMIREQAAAEDSAIAS